MFANSFHGGLTYFAHMGFKWVLIGFQVGPQLGELHM